MILIIPAILIVALIAIILWRRVDSNEKVSEDITCDEGQFFVRGKKNSFTIRKGNRFIFTVENGQIISVKDTAVSKQQIEYRGL